MALSPNSSHGTTGGSTGTPTDGWVDDTAETWTFASATTFTVASDLTAKYTPGTRLKLTQTTVKYFVVVSSVFGASTTVTVTGGTDFTLANAAITLNFHSYSANPQGYPTWFTYAPTATGFASQVGVMQFAVLGRLCTVNGEVSGTSNGTGITIPLPIPARSTGANAISLGTVRDNTTWSSIPGIYSIATSGTVANVYWTTNGTSGFTATGTKAIIGQFVYGI